MKRISVCLATYNGDKYIKDLLTSILSQLNNNDEVIVSDNNSKDNTISIIHSFNDHRIKIITNKYSKGPTLNFENALMHISGDYIFLADQDDIWLPGKVIKCMKELEDKDMVVTDCVVVNEELLPIQTSFFTANGSKKGLMNNLFKNSYLGCCMAFKKEVLAIALPFPSGIPMHDVWLGFVSELFFKTTFLNEPLLYYRRHGENESSASEKSPYSMGRKIKFRWNVVKYIPLLLKRKRLR